MSAAIQGAPDRASLVEALRSSLGARMGEMAVADLDADLFELGLDSIDAVEVTGDIEALFGIEVDPEILFECRSIGRTADTLSGSR